MEGPSDVAAELATIKTTLIELRNLIEDGGRAKFRTLFVTESEMCLRLGLPHNVARPIILYLNDKDPAFPKKQKLWGNRRYWPAVEQYFHRQNRTAATPLEQLGPLDQSEAPATRRSRRP
jgi:hypothetical protein